MSAVSLDRLSRQFLRVGYAGVAISCAGAILAFSGVFGFVAGFTSIGMGAWLAFMGYVTSRRVRRAMAGGIEGKDR